MMIPLSNALFFHLCSGISGEMHIKYPALLLTNQNEDEKIELNPGCFNKHTC